MLDITDGHRGLEIDTNHAGTMAACYLCWHGSVVAMISETDVLQKGHD